MEKFFKKIIVFTQNYLLRLWTFLLLFAILVLPIILSILILVGEYKPLSNVYHPGCDNYYLTGNMKTILIFLFAIIDIVIWSMLLKKSTDDNSKP